MAATRLIAVHINKGKTAAQSLADRLDYSHNLMKINDGEFVTGYECDPRTAREEFLLTKREYEQKTGRQQKGDVLACQIRQSFRPGEITPEEANRLGRELAMRFTKGKHAFTVSTHTDKTHIHNHIYFNSTTLDGTRKFKNFWFSGIPLQRVSDLICLENGLSVIESIEELRAKANASVEQLSTLSENIKSTEARIAEIVVLRKHIINYSKTRDVYVGYRKAGYSKKFFEEHREAITIHKAAKQAFDELGLKKIPRVKELNEEYYRLLSEKKQKVSEYYTTRKSMQELLMAQKNVEMFLAIEQKVEEKDKQKEAERR